MKIIGYPAVFTKDKYESGYIVEFPDLPGCLTEGETLGEAVEIAKDAIECYFADMPETTKPSPYGKVRREFPDKLVLMIYYEKKTENKKLRLF